MATGTWDQLCSLHADGRVDCTGYLFGDYRAPTPIAGPGHRSVWVDETGAPIIDDPSTYRVSEGRSTCRVTAAGLDCHGDLSGTAGNVAAGGDVRRFSSSCYLDGAGQAFCGGGCEGNFYCQFQDAQSCSYFSGCSVGAPAQHFTSAPVVHLLYHPYGDAVCGVLVDGSLWCFGTDPMGQGMLGGGDLAVDTMLAPPGSVGLPRCN